MEFLDELPVEPGPPDLRMGLRRISADQWLLRDDRTEFELSEKARLLAEHDDLVLLMDGHDEAAGELLAEVERFQRCQPSGLSGIAALERSARLTPEDQCLMARGADAWQLVGGSLVFGNQWTLAEKLGGSLIDIHEPTEGYAELLGAKVDAFFDRLPVDRVFARRNWFVHDIDDLHQPHAAPMRRVDDPAEVASLFVRSERETLRRLPVSDAIVFTIKTQIATFAQLKANAPAAAGVADHLAAASARGRRAKDADGRAEAIIEYLRS